MITFIGTLKTEDLWLYPANVLSSPEPVHHVGPVGLRDDLAAEVGDGREVHPDGDLQQQEGQEGDDGVCGGCSRPE